MISPSLGLSRVLFCCSGCPGCQVPLLSPGKQLWMDVTLLPTSPMDLGQWVGPKKERHNDILTNEREEPCRWVGFDDVDSIRLKAQFVNSRGLAGSMVWWELTFLSFSWNRQNNKSQLAATIWFFPLQILRDKNSQEHRVRWLQGWLWAQVSSHFRGIFLLSSPTLIVVSYDSVHKMQYTRRN